MFADDSLLQVNALSLRLTRPITPGDSATVSVDWTGRLVGYTETGSSYIRDRVDSAFTILRMDAFAYPRVGRPSHRALRAAGLEGFSYRVRVTVPRGLVVATGGGSVDATTSTRSCAGAMKARAPLPS